MRDPERIDVMIQLLRDVWRHNPDLRLGQLVYVATHSTGRRDVFEIEDDEMQESLRVMATLKA